MQDVKDANRLAFLRMELSWVMAVRRTRNNAMLHLVDAASLREKEIRAQIAAIEADMIPFPAASGFARRDSAVSARGAAE
jgi:hypothetical protein